MREWVFLGLVALAAGCLGVGNGASSEAVQGPADLGQPLVVFFQHPDRDDVILHVTLEQQEPFSYRMPGSCRQGSCIVPNVARVYEGSIPRETAVAVHAGSGPEVRLTIDDHGGPAYVIVQDCDCPGVVYLQREDESPGFD